MCHNWIVLATRFLRWDVWGAYARHDFGPNFSVVRLRGCSPLKVWLNGLPDRQPKLLIFLILVYDMLARKWVFKNFRPIFAGGYVVKQTHFRCHFRLLTMFRKTNTRMWELSDSNESQKWCLQRPSPVDVSSQEGQDRLQTRPYRLLQAGLPQGSFGWDELDGKVEVQGGSIEKGWHKK